VEAVGSGGCCSAVIEYEGQCDRVIAYIMWRVNTNEGIAWLDRYISRCRYKGIAWDISRLIYCQIVSYKLIKVHERWEIVI
jgi:hypothetical protein